MSWICCLKFILVKMKNKMKWFSSKAKILPSFRAGNPNAIGKRYNSKIRKSRDWRICMKSKLIQGENLEKPNSVSQYSRLELISLC